MTFDQLISKLLDETTVSNFNSITLHELNEQSPEFWKNLLNYLKNEETKLGHNYIRTEDLLESNSDSSSIFGRINELADLNDNAITNYINSIKNKLADNTTGVTSGKDYFWNESVSSLLSYVLLNFDNSIGDREIVSNIKVSDIKNANAGNSFNGGNWVRPWKNIDGNTYSDVRGTDKIESVLNNSTDLQFTRTAGVDKWLRLIMPKYTRAVEVEDLNRNFWVIAQVITAISAYLFDDDNPIFNTLERITKELIQLWENTLYLWLAIALISQRPYYTKLHSEIVVVNSKDFYGDVRYDNFEQGLTETTTLANIWGKISYLKDTYPECNLCIIPKIRLNNYEHNYYETERYPGAILYNRNKDEVSYQAFQETVAKESTFNCSDYVDELTSILDTMEGYKYIYPATNADGYPDTGAGRYHAFIRSEGTIDAIFDSDNDSINFNSFSLVFYDGGWDVVRGSNTRRKLATYKWEKITGQYSVNSFKRQSTIPSSITPVPSSAGTADYGRGYYLGDVMSYAAVSLELDYSIQAKNIKLTPMGGPHWGAIFENDSDSLYEMRNPYFNGGRWDIVGQADDEVKNHLRDQNMYILNQYYNQKIKNNNTGENITLLVASRNCDLYLTSNFCDQWLDSAVQSSATKRNELIGTNLGGYWYLNGSTITQATDIYDGKYYEPYPQSGGTYDDEIIRYTKVGKIVNNSGLDTMETIRKGYYIKTDGSPDTDNSGKLIRLNNTDFRSTSPTEDVINTTVVSSTITYHLPYRYNNFRQTDYRGAKLIIPGTDKVYNYNNFHHIVQMLPLKDEYPQKSDSLYTNDNDCAAQSVAWDSPDNIYGRKRYIQNYSYTFCRRGEVPSGDNWFMLYVQVVGTFRPFDKYFACIPFDTINDDFQLYTLFMQSGFSPLSGLSGQVNFNPNYTEASESLPIDDYSNKAMSSIKEQYLLKLTNEEQDELARKDNGNYVYADGDVHAIRYGFSNVSMSAKRESSGSEQTWHSVQVCTELAKAIAVIQKYIKNNGAGAEWWNATLYYDNATEAEYKKYLKPATAGAWLADNVLSATDTWRGRKIGSSTDTSDGGVSYAKSQKILNMVASSGSSVTVKSKLWGNELYEKMYPTISQVRCHLFIPRESNNYARYEKYCVNDYGQIMAQWTEKAAVNAPLWGQYANVLDSITNDIDSSYVRYDNNKYYFDFFHDPHHGRPDNPFPNKETVG